KYNIRLMGPNIYGFNYTPANLCATFCTAYDVKGHAALSSQSGGIGMAIIGFSRSAKMGVSAIVGLGNKSDIDEDDLLAFFEQDPNTNLIAQHCEDLKDGRAFAEAAKRVSKKKPVVVLKAGRTAAGAKAASSHTGALAGNDKIYEDVFKQSGVIRARSLRQLLEFARGVPVLPMVFARNMVEVKKEMEAKGFVKPIVASLAGDVEVEEASEYLYQNGIPAYAYSTELPVEVLGAKYKWARGAGLL